MRLTGNDPTSCAGVRGWLPPLRRATEAQTQPATSRVSLPSARPAPLCLLSPMTANSYGAVTHGDFGDKSKPSQWPSGQDGRMLVPVRRNASGARVHVVSLKDALMNTGEAERSACQVCLMASKPTSDRAPWAGIWD